MSYFDHPFISNSDLSKFAKELNGDDNAAPVEAYRMGSLIDGVVTEPDLIDRIQMKILSTGQSFTKSELLIADKVNAAFHANPFCAQIFKACKTQVEKYIRDVKFNANGYEFSLDMRCKYDFFSDALFADLKSTSATSQAAFEAACEQFGYWRQVAHYGNLASIKRAVIIGISKINFKVFIVRLEYGDERWQKGLREYQDLAYKYHIIKGNETITKPAAIYQHHSQRA